MTMTLEKLDELLNSLGYPVAYYQFKEEQELPYIAYLVVDGESFNADDKPTEEITNADIELYVEDKDLSIDSVENKIKKLLKDNELPWSYAERFIESEGVFQCTFSITLNGGF